MCKKRVGRIKTNISVQRKEENKVQRNGRIEYNKDYTALFHFIV
jgi:hypothetical protein